jgi:hypothetical protein
LNHRLAAVEADHPPRRADALGERPSIVPGAAADIQDPAAFPHLEEVERSALVRLDLCHAADAIQMAHEVLGIRAAIDIGEIGVGYLLGHDPSEIPTTSNRIPTSHSF